MERIKRSLWILVVNLLLGFLGTTLIAGDDGNAPDNVINALRKKFPNAKILEVEKEREHGKTVYEFQLKDGNKELEVAISSGGRILEVEKSDGDDDDAKEDDEEDDDEEDGDAEEEEDDDEDKDGKSSRKGASPNLNATYTEACGTCHAAYIPALLPAKSWEKILWSLDKHNGEEVELAAKDAKAISAYLRENAADKSRLKISRKIMKSLSGKTPTRISDISYIRKKHDDLSDKTFKREAIGSRANCSACHRTAAKGDFDDDHVKIPK